ncbi:MAG: LPXTG cell wall anchor domain-containing protein, partial [Oscillospiraceae bacterium]|nr:LPXTG cell wall anchor domain-containing protein [Oscillospiraceae bacterium]
FEATSDKPVVYTGAVNLLKADSADHANVLPGAVFEVYRLATAEELAENAESVVTREDIFAPVVRVSFFDNSLLTGNKVTSVTSDENGRCAIYGLPYGQYYLVETQSPEGYNLLEGPVELTVNANSHLEDNVIVVENVTGAMLPETGGIGTEVYTFTGILLMAVCTLLVLKKRRQADGTAN